MHLFHEWHSGWCIGFWHFFILLRSFLLIFGLFFAKQKGKRDDRAMISWARVVISLHVSKIKQKQNQSKWLPHRFLKLFFMKTQGMKTQGKWTLLLLFVCSKINLFPCWKHNCKLWRKPQCIADSAELGDSMKQRPKQLFLQKENFFYLFSAFPAGAWKVYSPFSVHKVQCYSSASIFFTFWYLKIGWCFPRSVLVKRPVHMLQPRGQALKEI